jgi:hypothetical protein
VILYQKRAFGTGGGFIIGTGYGGCPDGSGTTPDVWFDDVVIPAATLTGFSYIDVDRVTIGMARVAGNAPGTISVYWAGCTSGTVNPNTAVDTPPTLIGTSNYTTSATTALNVVNFGTDGGPTLFTVPLNMGFTVAGGVPGTAGTFFMGCSFSNQADPDNVGWVSVTQGVGDNGSVNNFYIYDTDLGPIPAQAGCSPGPENGPWSFGVASATVPASSFYMIIHGTAVAGPSPIACCLPAASGSVCYVTGSAANCTQSGGTSQAGVTTCAAGTCVAVVCCNNTTGVCSVATGTCPGTLVAQVGATTCTGITCQQLPPPLNDDCFTLVAGSEFELTIPGQPSRLNQTNVSATPSFGAGVGTACSFSDTDVWYLFTATAAQATQQFRISVTPQASSGDFTLQPLNIAVYDAGLGCPAAPGGELACADFANPSSTIFTGNGSLSYFIRVAYGAPGTTKFDIAIQQVQTVACCNPSNGLCVLSNNLGQCTTQAGYTEPQGSTTCTPNPCPRGSCCSAGGACGITGQNGCPPANFTLNGTCAPANLCAGACCNTATFACTLNDAAGCGVGNTFQGGGSVCTTVGICPAPPNDQCASAAVVTLNAAINGTVNSSTGVDLTACSTAPNDVWYTFTPPGTGNYSIKLPPASATDVGGGLAIFTGACDPVANAELDCIAQPADGETTELLDTLIAGTPVLIRVGSFPGDTGNFSLLISQPGGLGACCTVSANCLVVAAAADCPAPAAYQGLNTTCAAPATQCPAGSCCFPRSGQCFVTTQPFCTDVTGVWNAGDQACATTNCVVQTPVNDDCTTALTVTSPTFTHHQGTDGAAAEAPPISQCNDETATADLNSVWYTFTAPSAGVLNIKATNYGTFDMIMGVYTGACGALTEIGCADDPEPYDININMPAASNVKFEIAQFGLSAGGGWLTVNTSFAVNGQCCIAGACTVTTQAACTGTWTSGGTCTVNNCPVATGICCRGATCNTTISQANCTTTASLAGAQFIATSTVCTGTTLAGCCNADYNKVNGIEVQDIFDFINDWLASKLYANTNGNGNTGPLAVQNIFDFINEWLAGCH